MAKESVFSGLKVLDLASFIAGPAATTALSDFGADVIKIEPPGTGDPYRFFYQLPPNPACKENYTWQVTNRNKRSLTVDLKNPESQSILARLVGWADVLVINFPPRVRKALKLTYEDLSPLNPRLIYADITGYGEEGPEADKPGFDVTAYWARSGLMQFTRNAGSPPAVPVPGIGDHATAISLYAGIVTALYRRERTGKGCNVSTSLIANGAWATAAWLQAALSGAKFSGEIDRANPANALAGVSYQTSDQRWILLAFADEDKSWPPFIKAMGQASLMSDPRFADGKVRHANSALLVAELDRLFAAQPLAYWKVALDAARVPYGIVQIPEEIVRDPQLLANKIIVPVENGAPGSQTVDTPLTIKEAPKVAARVAPALGEHTVEVLRELGFVDSEIEDFRAGGAIPHVWHLAEVV
jgi:crotonobetainyl-CoA:carnitine CoA-transferase CaiB-like acyl-CoA transferase